MCQKEAKEGDQVTQSAKDRHSCKILGSIWPSNVDMRADNIAKKTCCGNMKRQLVSWRSWDLLGAFIPHFPIAYPLYDIIKRDSI